MSERDFQRLINERIEEFVRDITELAREHAVKTLAEALGVSGEAATAAASGRRKRSPAELDRLQGDLAEHVAANPGIKMQDIAAHFGVTARSLALPMKKLLADGQVRSEGQRRATRYFPGKKRNRKRA